ncbi:MAG: arginine--tRNA ligase [Gammaproteobacteria bacterium]|nr:arginine--tRNA ligase [Gammaproteobacteria bacterium]
MKSLLQTLLQQAATPLAANHGITLSPEQIQVDHTKDKKFGDFSSNIAMVLAKSMNLQPRELAQQFLKQLSHPSILKMEIAGPGFINFYMDPAQQTAVIMQAITQKERFGCSNLGAGKRVHIEFVSANPTGPLHVGHGRGAAFGAAVADILAATGHHVHREYYVNDAGRQMHILATSTWLRYLELCGEKFNFPSNAYKGDYVIDLAKKTYEHYSDRFHLSTVNIFAGVPADEGEPNGDKDAHIDGLIKNAKELLGKEKYAQVFAIAKDDILADIRKDLEEFGVIYDEWFSEQSLVDGGAFEIALEALKASSCIYEADGAVWFRATDFGDEKDRVLIKENGDRTYFANDIAYHVNKYRRSYDQVIDVLGADHHGYVPRIQGVLKALGHGDKDFVALLVQFAILYRGNERVQMSTRSGSFVTLRELREEVGNDAVRFFYVMRKNEQHMDFDLELAKSQSNENPVYYIQYAHARICSVFRQLTEKSLVHAVDEGAQHLVLLNTPHEIALIDQLSRYPDTLAMAAKLHEPHSLANYLRLLANDFHAYYNAHPFIVEDANLCNARLNLILAVQQCLRNGLALLGVSAPEKM